MTTSVVRAPTSDEAVSGSWTGTVNSRFANVDDYPDTSADGLRHGTTAGNLTFGFSAFSIPTFATSISVFLDYQEAEAATGVNELSARLKVGGSYFDTDSHDPPLSVTQRTSTFATNPKTGAAWTPAQINGTDGTNDLQAFGFSSSDASPRIDIFSAQLRVEYSYAPLTAASGSFTLTGQATTLRAARKITAAQGSLALTGNSAGLLAARKITAAQGSLALTGNATGLLAGRRLTAAQGSLALSGQAVTLGAGRLVSAASGLFALSGQAAGLRATRTLAAVSGSLAVSATSAVLLAGRSIVASSDAGDFTLTGQAVTLRAARTLAASSGSFALTGSSTGLLAGRTLAGSHGPFALAGQAAALRAARLLAAGPGSLALAGRDAGLVFAPAGAYGLAVDAGLFALAGQALELRAGRRLVADAGAFALIGQDVELGYVASEPIEILAQPARLRLRAPRARARSPLPGLSFGALDAGLVLPARATTVRLVLDAGSSSQPARR